MISFKIIFDLLINDAAYWSKLKEKHEYILERGRLSHDERKKIDLEAFTDLAFNMYAKEILKNIIMESKKYSCYRIRGSQKPKNGGGYWPNFYTVIKILVAGEENLGLQEKIVNLKFNQLIKTDHLKEGFLIVEKCKRKEPKLYEIKEENGVKKYPYIWIDEIYSFEEDELEVAK